MVAADCDAGLATAPVAYAALAARMIAQRGTLGATFALAREFVQFDGRRAAVGAALMVMAALSEGMGLALLAPLMAILTGAGGGRLLRFTNQGFELVGVAGDGPRLAVIMGAFVAAVTLRALLVAARDRHLFDLQLDFTNSRRLSLIRLVAASRWSDIATLRHARITQALSGDIPRVGMAVQTFLTITLTLTMLVAQAALVALLAPRLALAALVALAAAGILSVPLTRKAYTLGQYDKQRGLRLVDITAQLMGGLKLALAQNLAGAFVTEFEDTLSGQTAAQRDYDRRRVRAQTVSAISVAAALAALVVLGHAWSMPAANLLASLAILSRMVGPAMSLLRSIRMLAQALPSFVGICALEAMLGGSAPTLAPTGGAARFGGGAIRFAAVSYRYPGGGGICARDVTIAPGSVVALVGPSGAGKTTFADLLSGLLCPLTGHITVGGAPLEGSAVAAWRDRIAYVAQDSYLFHDTIRRNLCWGDATITDAALWTALERVEAAAMVAKIEGGLNAVVAERGTRLSGGERQRLALARALLRQPDLLILDEATNAVDVAMEEAIFQRLVTASPGMTIVLASHRPDLLRFCSQIIDVDATGAATTRQR